MENYLKWALNRVSLYIELDFLNKKDFRKILFKLAKNKIEIKKIGTKKENKIDYILDNFYFEDIENLLNNI